MTHAAFRTLWVLPGWPLPAEDGASRATLNLLQNLSRTGEWIDLLVIADARDSLMLEDAKAILGVRNVYVVRRPPIRDARLALGSLLWRIIVSPLTPIPMEPFSGRLVRRAVDRLIATGMPDAGLESVLSLPIEPIRWDAIVYDGLAPAIHAFSLTGSHPESLPPRVIYRAHHREAEWWERRASRGSALLYRALFSFEAMLVRLIEDSVVRSASGVAAVSRETLQAFRRESGELRGEVVPIGYEFGEIPAFPQGGDLRVLFFGRLDWYPNIEGLRWFLDHVWPRVTERRRDIELVIAGSGDGSWLSAYAGLPRVTLRGRVESASDAFEGVSLALVPMFYPTGTQVKTIEASRFGRPVLSTDMGVEGCGFSDKGCFFRANFAEEWIATLCSTTIDEARIIGRRAYNEARETFDSMAAALSFLKILRDVR